MDGNTAADDEAFRFFDLPAELRNLVYDNLTRTIQVYDQKSLPTESDSYDPPRPLMFAKGAPIISVLLANCQLNGKYRKQIRHHLSLKVINPVDPFYEHEIVGIRCPLPWPQDLPKACTKAVKELTSYGRLASLEHFPLGAREGRPNYHLGYQLARSEIEALTRDIEGRFTRQFQNLEAIDFRLFTATPIGWPEASSLSDEKVERFFEHFDVQKFWQHPLARSCELSLLYQEEEHEKWWRREEELAVYGSWTRDGGWRAGKQFRDPS